MHIRMVPIEALVPQLVPLLARENRCRCRGHAGGMSVDEDHLSTVANADDVGFDASGAAWALQIALKE
jgi:hypothetical protein